MPTQLISKSSSEEWLFSIMSVAALDIRLIWFTDRKKRKDLLLKDVTDLI